MTNSNIYNKVLAIEQSKALLDTLGKIESDDKEWKDVMDILKSFLLSLVERYSSEEKHWYHNNK